MTEEQNDWETSKPVHENSNGHMSSANFHPFPLTLPNDEQLMNRLQDKVTLIMGGATENGRSLAVALAEKGSDVVIVYFNESTETAKEIQEQVEAVGRRCLTIKGNMLDRQASEHLMQRIVDAFGRLDIFISFSAQLAKLKQPLTHTSSTRHLRVKIFPELCVMTAAVQQMLVNG